MSWFQNNIAPKISDTYMFLNTTKDVWDCVCKTYSKVNDVAQIYEIKKKMSSAKQGTYTVTKYTNYLKGFDRRQISIKIYK